MDYWRFRNCWNFNSISKTVENGASFGMKVSKYYNYSYKYKLFQQVHCINRFLRICGPILLGYLVIYLMALFMSG
jgi:hypothetical protein